MVVVTANPFVVFCNCHNVMLFEVSGLYPHWRLAKVDRIGSFCLFVALLFSTVGAVDGIGFAVDVLSGAATDGPATVGLAFILFFVAGAETGGAFWQLLQCKEPVTTGRREPQRWRQL